MLWDVLIGYRLTEIVSVYYIYHSFSFPRHLSLIRIPPVTMINEATFVEQGQLVAFEHNGDEVLGIIGKQRKGNLLQITFSAAVNDGFVHTKNSVETKERSIFVPSERLSRIAYINRMQQMVPSSQTEAMVADAFRTWKIVDTRAKCVVQAAYRVKGFQTVQKMRAMKTVIKLLRRRKSDILGCVFARLKFATGAVVMLSKTESKRKALESLETTKAETKKIRSNTNHMMRRFRSNFNEKANIIEELLQERQQLDKIKRDTEIMRLKADELAQKIRDWESGKRTSDFLHYENVETMTARGKPSQNNMVVELI